MFFFIKISREIILYIVGLLMNKLRNFNVQLIHIDEVMNNWSITAKGFIFILIFCERNVTQNDLVVLCKNQNKLAIECRFGDLLHSACETNTTLGITNFFYSLVRIWIPKISYKFTYFLIDDLNKIASYCSARSFFRKHSKYSPNPARYNSRHKIPKSVFKIGLKLPNCIILRTHKNDPKWESHAINSSEL